MSQLSYENENPLDWYFGQICDAIAPFFYETGHTANMITTEGAVASAWGLYNLYYGNLGRFAIGYSLGYFFDCLDGFYARKYRMVSKFGDLYEHGKDILTSAAFFYIFLTKYHVAKPVVLAYLASGALLGVHMANQQKELKKKGGFLSILEPLNNIMDIKLSRLFGCATFMVATVALPYLSRRIL